MARVQHHYFEHYDSGANSRLSKLQPKGDHQYQAPGMTAALPLALVLFQYQSAISEETTKRLKHSLTGVTGGQSRPM